MAERKYPTLPAVAHPATILWVPQVFFGVNVGFHVVILEAARLLFGIGPVLPALSLIVVHVVLAIVTMKEPHLMGLSRAAQRHPRTTRNLVKFEGGTRYVP